MAGENIGALKAYLVVKEVGQERFEKRVNELVGMGYVPVGGLTVAGVVHPITGQEGMGFMQPMFRRPPVLS